MPCFPSVSPCNVPLISQAPPGYCKKVVNISEKDNGSFHASPLILISHLTLGKFPASPSVLQKNCQHQTAVIKPADFV